jgi:hypothetical protein
MQRDDNSPFVRYLFSKEESINARMFSEVQLAYLHTLRSQLAEQLALEKVPTSPEEDRAFWLRRAEMQAKLDLFQELFDNHKNAFKEMTEIAAENNTSISTNGSQEMGDVALRAAKLVHQISEDI